MSRSFLASKLRGKSLTINANNNPESVLFRNPVTDTDLLTVNTQNNTVSIENLALSGDVVIPDNLEVQGNLTILGNFVTANVKDVEIGDRIIRFATQLGHLNTSDNKSLGMIADYYDTTQMATRYTGWFRNHSVATRPFTFFTNYPTLPGPLDNITLTDEASQLGNIYAGNIRARNNMQSPIFDGSSSVLSVRNITASSSSFVEINAYPFDNSESRIMFKNTTLNPNSRIQFQSGVSAITKAQFDYDGKLQCGLNATTGEITNSEGTGHFITHSADTSGAVNRALVLHNYNTTIGTNTGLCFTSRASLFGNSYKASIVFRQTNTNSRGDLLFLNSNADNNTNSNTGSHVVMKLSANGKVCVGNTVSNPLGMLEIGWDPTERQILLHREDGGANGIISMDSSQHLNISSTSGSGTIKFNSNISNNVVEVARITANELEYKTSNIANIVVSSTNNAAITAGMKIQTNYAHSARRGQALSFIDNNSTAGNFTWTIGKPYNNTSFQFCTSTGTDHNFDTRRIIIDDVGRLTVGPTAKTDGLLNVFSPSAASQLTIESNNQSVSTPVAIVKMKARNNRVQGISFMPLDGSFVEETAKEWFIGKRWNGSSEITRFSVAYGGTDVLRLTTAGRLAIGNIDPAVPLHVQTADAEIARFTRTGVDGFISLYDTSTRIGYIQNNNGTFDFTSDNRNLRLRAIGNFNIVFNRDNIERARIDSNSFCINTTTGVGSRVLVVNGSSRMGNIENGNTTSPWSILSNTSTTNSRFYIADTNGNVAFGATTLRFLANSTDASEGVEAARISSSGNMSIGNTNNTHKLDVTGTVRVTGDLIIDNQGSFTHVNFGDSFNYRYWTTRTASCTCVYLHISTKQFTATSTEFTAAGAVPAAIRPASARALNCTFLSNNISRYVPGMLVITDTGAITYRYLDISSIGRYINNTWAAGIYTLQGVVVSYVKEDF